MGASNVGLGQQTVVGRAFTLFRVGIHEQFEMVCDWRRHAAARISTRVDDISEWVMESKARLLGAIVLILFAALLIWLLAWVATGEFQSCTVKLRAYGVLVAILALGIFAPAGMFFSFVVLLVLPRVVRVLSVGGISVGMLLWVPVYAIWRTVVLALQLLVLVPLSLLFIVTRSVQLWKGIFWTCPGRGCSYRGLPAFVCPDCGELNDHLWPNLYGVLYHPCVRCRHALPTLASRGRNALERHCGNPQCRILLSGKHAGRAPERLVGIVGGSGSGKTNYMLMAVNEIINGKSNLRGQIDEPEQGERFERDWGRLSRGLVVDVTVEVMKAFLLYVKMGGVRSQLYLYDAPGEEFESLAGMSKQQYFPLLDGFILMADPTAFPVVRQQEDLKGPGPTPLDDIVMSTIMRATTETPLNRNGKIDMRVAVVISKADLPAVRERIGDIRAGKVDSAACRKAISEWGGTNAIQGIENRFESVEYFACSALGRDPDDAEGEAFEGYGVIGPLVWTLKQKSGV